MKNTWQSLSKLNATLHIKNINIAKGKTIMDKIITKATKKELIRFNEIRKHLKYFELSEIASQESLQNFLNGVQSSSTWNYPESLLPPRWKISWKRLIKNMVTYLKEIQ